MTLTLMADNATTNQAMRFVLICLEPDVSTANEVVYAGAVLMLPSVEAEIMRLRSGVDALREVVAPSKSAQAREPFEQLIYGVEKLIERLTSAKGADGNMRAHAQEIVDAHRTKLQAAGGPTP